VSSGRLPSVSVVTPTLRRPREVVELLENLGGQSHLPREILLVDGAPLEETATEEAVAALDGSHPFACHYIRHGGGTAIQRNVGIDRATGDLVAFVDDDVRLEPDFLEVMARVFAEAPDGRLGAVVGFRTNKFFPSENSERWRWYRRLRLLRIFEPGRYDRDCGYPINAGMQPPFSGVREVDFMTTACAVWNRRVFDEGLRFDPFFRDYGVLEDAHISLRAGRTWRLLQCGDAHCQELSAPGGRESSRKIGYKGVVNYYYVFKDVEGPLSLGQRFRFWRFQAFDVIRLLGSFVRRRKWGDLEHLLGKFRAFLAVITGLAYRQTPAKQRGSRS
jgi:glycosyltransferase involved in cell wall biosynthesis